MRRAGSTIGSLCSVTAVADLHMGSASRRFQRERLARSKCPAKAPKAPAINEFLAIVVEYF